MSVTAVIQRARDSYKLQEPVVVCSVLYSFGFPIAEIVIGSMYLHECPRQRYIPIYLIVLGVFSLVLAIFSYLPCAKKDKNSPETENIRLRRLYLTWNSNVTLFLLCWFIAGNVWIYPIYQPNYNKNATDVSTYCNKTLYLFAFWITTLVYILVALSLFIVMCFICWVLCAPPRTANNVQIVSGVVVSE